MGEIQDIVEAIMYLRRYLFRAPNPWVFGVGKHYVTHPAQRAEIPELGRVRHPVISALEA
jgi:hypothetical protein